MLFLCALVLGLPAAGCSRFQPQPNPQLTSMEKKLETLEQLGDSTSHKADQMDRRLAELQSKVDAYGKALEKLAGSEAGLSKKGAGLKEGSSEESAPEKYRQSVLVPKYDKSRTVTASVALPPEKIYEKALRSYRERAMEAALEGFSAFVERHPKHGLADNAHYWIGEIHYDRGRYAEAIRAFEQVVRLFPEKEKAADALLKMGYAYTALNEKDKATAAFRRVLTDYPFSSVAPAALERLQKLKGS